MRRLLPLLALLPLFLLACTKELTCPQGETPCHGTCVALAHDAANCGACGHTCGGLAVCAAGSCGCAPGTAACGGACVDLRTDPSHCGACDTTCGGATALCASGASTACVATCPAGQLACGGACVDQQSDRFNCGGCGLACAQGQACRGGACRSDVQVACGSTGEVVPVTADLQPAGAARPVGYYTTALAVLDGVIYATSGYPATVDMLPLDPALVLPASKVTLGGNDLEDVATHDNLVFVANAGAGTLVVLTAAGEPLDEIPLGDQQSGPNPRSITFVGDRAYVVLGGFDPKAGQAVAVVDLSGLAACAAPDPGALACGAGGACPSDRHCVDNLCRRPCGSYQKTIDLLAVPGSFDAPGAPFPARALAVGSKVFVALNNLELASLNCNGYQTDGYVKPAGSGRLAVIDAARGDAVSVIDLGPGCGNPGGLALDGSTLWVSCGSLCFPGAWPGAVVPVDLSGTPRVGSPVGAPGIVPNGVAICGSRGYLWDQNSGAVMPFSPADKSVAAPVTICPLSAYGSAYVAALACTP
jgi:hypothetical protein